MTGRAANVRFLRRAGRPRQLSAPRLAAVSTSTRVATYADVRGAALAVEHLLGRGFDPADVEVRPADLSVRPVALADVPAEPRRHRAVIAASITGIVWLRWHGATINQVLLAAIVAALVGGLAHAGDALALRLRRSRRARAANTVSARRFEVLVARDQQRAELELARWWDPEAMPAAWKEPDAGHRAGRRTDRSRHAAIAA